jgi:hypothetical protein
VKRLPKGATPEERKKHRAAMALRKKELKLASKEVARKLFPKVDTGKDADALLIAEWMRRTDRGGSGDEK